MFQLSQHITLSGGTVTLRAWGAHVAEGLLIDLFAVTSTLGAMRDHWAEFEKLNTQRTVWSSFRRLVEASLDDCPLPSELTWNDRLLLLDSMWELNDVETSEKRLAGLTRRAQQMHQRRQARTSAMMKS